MVHNNKELEQDGCGNGSLCRLLQVRLKHGKYPNLMRVDNWKAFAVTVSAVDYFYVNTGILLVNHQRHLRYTLNNLQFR